MSIGDRSTAKTGAAVVAPVFGAGTQRANRSATPTATGLATVNPNERRDIPSEDSPNFDAKVRESISVYLGKRGDPLDRGITVRDLLDAGMISVGSGFLANPSGFNPIQDIGSKLQASYVVDLSPPPTPTEFTAVGAISNIVIGHSAPTFTNGNGYAKTVVYGVTYNGSGVLPVFADAVKLTEFIGTVFSYPTDPATTWRLWITWVTKDGVESTIPAGGLNGLQVVTAQNPAKLLSALAGQITASQLYADLNARINLIDGGAASTHLAYPLVDIAASQDALNQRIFRTLNGIGSDILLNAATINTTAGLVTGAGIYLDPGTGTVKISGLEATNTYLSTVDARLSAAESSITLKATKTYVDNLVATAVITPSQVPVIGTLAARMDTAELNISGLTASVALKAASVDLSATNARVTTAETNISSLTGTIANKVDSATFTSVTGGLDVRLGSAESAISSLGGASTITNLVQQGARRDAIDEATAETLLRNILNTQNVADARAADIALARSDLTAYIDAGISAEATSRLALATILNGNTATLVSQQSVINGLSAQSMVKVDVNGHVSGFGLYSDSTNSQFIISTDQFAVTTPATSIPAWAATTAYATVGKIASVSSSTSKMLVCKVAGTSGPTEPDVSAAIGSVVVDGTVTWQIASRVPFSVMTSGATINGVSVGPGVYIDGAFIVNSTIGNAQIAALAVDDNKIASLNVSKLTAGSLTVGQYVQSGTQHDYGSGVEPDWKIDSNGLAIFNNAVVRGTVYATDGKFTGEVEALGAGGDKARMYAGNFEIYKAVPYVGTVLYKALSRVEYGTGSSGVTVTIPGYFKSQPKVIVSINSMQMYSAAYANQNQTINVNASIPVESSPGSMVWSFVPTANLMLGASTGNKVINQASGSTQTDFWVSAEYVTDNYTSSITPVITIASYRGNGSSVYYFRTVRWRVEYYDGINWITTAPFTTVNLAGDVNASNTSQSTFNFPSAGTWRFRIRCETLDTNGSTFGSSSYATVVDTVTRSGDMTITAYGNYNQTGHPMSANNRGDYTVAYNLPTGWTAVSYKTTYLYDASCSNTDGSSIADVDQGITTLIHAQNQTVTNATGVCNSFVTNAVPFYIGITWNFGYGSVSLTVHSATLEVTRKQLIANSTVPVNYFTFASYGYALASAQVLSTGSLNWVAIGD